MGDIAINPGFTHDDAVRLAEAVRLTGGSRYLKVGFKRNLMRACGSVLARAMVDLTIATSGCRIDDPHNAFEIMVRQEGMIGACWHNRLLSMLLAFRGNFGRSWPTSRCVAVISESDDGEIIARFFRDLGGNCVRGSSSRRAEDALRGMVRELERGASVFITPDGPRGPRYRMADGLIQAARLSGKPIVPVTGSFGRCIRLRRTWDEFEVPLPFGRFTFHFGQPTYVPRELSPQQYDEVKAQVFARMMENTKRAEAVPCRAWNIGKPKTAKG